MSTTHLSLRDLSLQEGQARREDIEVDVPPYSQAGSQYAASGPVPARIDISAMVRGLAMRLRMGVDVHGPCARCLEDATLHIEVDSHEVHDPQTGDPELISDFVTVRDELDVSSWAIDAVGLEFPVRVLCREDCAGLCPTCGTNRNESDCDCVVDTTDSRWDVLRGLSFDGDAADE